MCITEWLKHIFTVCLHVLSCITLLRARSQDNSTQFFYCLDSLRPLWYLPLGMSEYHWHPVTIHKETVYWNYAWSRPPWKYKLKKHRFILSVGGVKSLFLSIFLDVKTWYHSRMCHISLLVFMTKETNAAQGKQCTLCHSSGTSRAVILCTTRQPVLTMNLNNTESTGILRNKRYELNTD